MGQNEYQDLDNGALIHIAINAIETIIDIDPDSKNSTIHQLLQHGLEALLTLEKRQSFTAIQNKK